LPFQSAPLISWASAGDAHAYEDQGYNVPRIPTTCRDPHAYCLEIEGDSMEPKYSRGDIVVVAPSREARNGELVIARTKTDETYFKVYHGEWKPARPSETEQL
jgi:phage repressor protein C with HTH and peptisase S24 domain